MYTPKIERALLWNVFRSRMDYYYCMKNSTNTCSFGFTSQLQTMLTLADGVLMNSEQCPDDVMEQHRRMQMEEYMEMMYGAARNDLSIKLVTEMIGERVQLKRDSEEMEKEMEEDDQEDKENKEEDDRMKEGEEKDEMMKDDDEDDDDDKEMDKEK